MVHDAFGTARRAHSSTEGVTGFSKPGVSGLLLKKGLDYLEGTIDEPRRPRAAIGVGTKASTKIPVIESMLEKVGKLVFGRGTVLTFHSSKFGPLTNGDLANARAAVNSTTGKTVVLRMYPSESSRPGD